MSQNRRFVLGGLFAFLLPFAAHAVVNTWTAAGGDNNWSTPGNWSLGHSPGPGEDAVVDQPGAFVYLQVDATCQSLAIGSAGNLVHFYTQGNILAANTIDVVHSTLQLSGGSVEGLITLDDNSVLEWSGGQIGGALPTSLTLTGGSQVDVDGPLPKSTADGVTITLASDCTFFWNEGSIDLGQDVVVTIAGDFIASADGTIFSPPAPHEALFDLTGPFTASPVGPQGPSGPSGPVGVSEILAHVNVTDTTVHVTSGVLRLGRGGTMVGTTITTIDSGTSLELGDPPSQGGGLGPVDPAPNPPVIDFEFHVGTDLVGQGSLVVRNRLVDFAGHDFDISVLRVEGGHVATYVPAYVDHLVLDGGSLEGVNAPTGFTVSEYFDWSDGTLAGLGITVVELGAHLEIAGLGTPSILDGHMLFLQGTAHWASGDFRIEQGGTLRIEGTATFDSSVDGTLGGGGTILNLGAFGRDYGASPYGTTVIEPFLANFGNAGSLRGILEIAGSSMNNGNLGADVGAALRFIGGTHDSQGGSILANGTVSFVDASASIGMLQVYQLTMANSLVEVGGQSSTILGSLTGGSLTGPMTINGPFDWFSGSILGGSSTTIATTGTLNITGADAKALGTDHALQVNGRANLTGSGNLSVAASLFVGATGRFTISTDADVTGPSAFIQNSGIFEKTNGLGTSVVQPTFQNLGTVKVFKGTLEFTSYTQDAGKTELHDAILASPNDMVFHGGSLVGNGTLQGNVVNHGADVAPGFSEGKLTITSNYTQTEGSSMTMEASGTAQGRFDQLAVGGTASVGGTLNVVATEGYAPAPGDKLSVVTAPTVQGAFSEVNTPTGENGAEMEGKITANGFEVVAPVAFQIANGSTGTGTQATINLSFATGPLCAKVMSGTFTFPSAMSILASAGTGGCTFAATPVSPGLANWTCNCPVGVTGTQVVGSMLVNLASATPRATISCGTANATDCAGSTTSLVASCVAGTVFQGCLGDLHPDGVGDSLVNLQDFVLARRKILGLVATTARDNACGDMQPGNFVCTPADAARAWCPDGNDTFVTGDTIVIRQIVSGLSVLSCTACDQAALTIAQPPPMPGDVAPRGLRDASVNVADVVALLRGSVGLDELDATALTLGDIAPAEIADGGVTQPVGNDRIDVSDIVLLLRAAVGLTRLEWPLREIVLVGDAQQAFTAFTVRSSGWPAWAEIASVASESCENADLDGVDSWGDVLSVTCVSEGGTLAGAADLAVVRYRALRAIDPATLVISGEAVSEDLALVPAEFRADAR